MKNQISALMLLGVVILLLAPVTVSSQITTVAPTTYASPRNNPVAAASGNQSAKSNNALIDKLPASMRERGQALLSEPTAARRARMADELAQADAASTIEFLFAVAAAEPKPEKWHVLITRLGRRADAPIRKILESHAAGDADARLALLAIEALRVQSMNEVRQLLARRMEMARTDDDAMERSLLAEEHERWISLASGTMLPGFLRAVPPIFSLKAESAQIRVLAFGDFGTGSEGQVATARAMLQFHKLKPFDFGVTLGDNFYSDGMMSHTDPRWKTQWADLYNPLGIHFYASFGNHDWNHPDSPAAELIYAQQNPSWRLPAPYYTFTAGPVQFFALDTNEISEKQLMWLGDTLAKSQARWKVVYGHHPIYSASQHGDSPKLIKQLLPVLRGKADVYLTGHDHGMQHLKPETGLHFFIAGSGGARPYPMFPNERSLFGRSAFGFAVLEADAKRMKVGFIGADGSQLYEYALAK